MQPRITLLLRMLASALAGVLAGFFGITWINHPAPGRLATVPVASQLQVPGRVFASDAGIMIKFIKTDKIADFEATVVKLRQALARSNRPERRQQAATWKVFRAVEPATNGDAVYVFMMDPAINSADYAVSSILAEAFPIEAKSLYKRYTDSYSAGGQNIVDMTLIASFAVDQPR
jgi:hypothetical protein